MKKRKLTPLTEAQIKFFLESFFKNPTYPGWGTIAAKLLESGKCIVPGKECIWVGGIGNFIETASAKEAVDCLEYSFNVEYFIQSEWFKQVKKLYLNKLFVSKDNLEKELKVLNQALTEINQL